MNSKNIKTSNPQNILLSLTDKIQLNEKRSICCFIKPQHLLYVKKMKKSFKNKKFKISTPTWNEKFELPDTSYSVSDIHNYYKYVFKKHKTEFRITFKIKKGYYLELLTPGTVKSLRRTKSKITEDEKSENLLLKKRLKQY